MPIPSRDVNSIRCAIVRFEVGAPDNKPVVEDPHYGDSVLRPKRDELHQAFYIGLGEKRSDPSDDLLDRFRAHVPAVKKWSDSELDPSPRPGMSNDMAALMYNVRDKETGAVGARLCIRRIRWRKPDVVDAEGSVYSGGLYSEGYVWVVVRAKGEWKVKRRKSTWIS
jgi:hypothetical protein